MTGTTSSSSDSEPAGADTEIVGSLRRYMQYDTTNPPGAVGPAVDYLAGLLKREQIETIVLEPFPGKKILVARLSGEQRGNGLVLLGHSDVVGVESGWSVDPFGGTVADGYVWGRGALDMKGMTIMQLWAMVALKRARLRLQRDLVLVVVPDEEQGGFQGAEWLTAHHPELCRGTWLINEGGMGIHLADRNEDVFICSVGEKGPLWLKLSTGGVSGHSAIPNDRNALETLTSGIARVLSRHKDIRIRPYHHQLLDYLGVTPTTPYAQLPNRLYLRPQLVNTVSLTQLNGGIKQNVIPEAASAILDCRLLPGQDMQEFLDELRRDLGDDRIDVSVQVFRDASASHETGIFRDTLEALVREHFPHAKFFPYIAPYFTDSLFFRRLGVQAFGLMPILISEDDVNRIHGIDERLSIENLQRGARLLTELCSRMCATLSNERAAA